MQFNFKKILPHLAAVVGFILIGFLFCLPVLQGKRLNQTDTMMAKAAAQESYDFHTKTGEWAWWSNSMFGGMPTYMVAGDYPNSISSKVGAALNYIAPAPVNFLVLSMIGMYILLIVLGCSVWQSVLGAAAFAFGSYNVLNIEAGHISKVLALAYGPPIIAGVILCLRGRYWVGTALSALAMSLELYANHVQITYYLALSILILVVIEGVKLIRSGNTRQLLVALGLLVLSSVIAVGSHATRLWNNYEYSKETIRGGSELAATQKEGAAAGSKTGLDRDYAYGWSYGVAETGTLLIPAFYGGANGGLSTKSEIYKTLDGKIESSAAEDFAKRAAPLYWGDLPFTGGPAYAGAIICFLFILGLILHKSTLRWWLLGATVMLVMFSWGKNFATLNYFLFDHLPLFNKFRAVNMILSLVQLFLAIGAVLALKELDAKKWTLPELKKPLAISLGLTAGIALIFALMPTVFFNFRTANDLDTLTRMGGKDLANLILEPLIKDRISLFSSDAWRSVGYIVVAAALVWAFATQKLKPMFFYPILLVLILFDLMLVDKRYFPSEAFVPKSDIEETFTKTPTDELILADKALDFRVFDNAAPSGFMNSAMTSYYHKSIGGYHAAKLRRYQELIENQVAKNNTEVLNMLNTKYFLMQTQQGGAVQAQQNPAACGNAWFVKEFKIVPNADAEMKAMDKFSAKQTAFIDKEFESQVSGLKIVADSTNKITLTSYQPNALVYESDAKTEQLAIFSEIYYRGGIDWNVYLDGVKSQHLRADYILRGMRTPAGKHKIEFKFEPVSVAVGGKIDLISSILLVTLIAGAIFIEVRKK